MIAKERVAIDIKYLPWQQDVFFDHPDKKYIMVPKGRRPGATKGAINACVDWAIDGVTPVLWVDTVNGNIDKYYELYMLPVINQIPKKYWKWSVQKRTLNIFESVIHFRSADAPESIEGFGYKKIILNEAGIILKNDYLYNNTILPMLMDYSDSQLFALGVPKGIHKKDGNVHQFYTLCQRAGDTEEKTGDSNKSHPAYYLRRVTAFDNPLLSDEDIENLENEISTQTQKDQEIYGLFVDGAGENPFATAYNPEIHESEEVVRNHHKQLFISIDFNLNPFAVTFSHIWQDSLGMHLHTFDEAEIGIGSIPAMIKLINGRYADQLHNCLMTGDSGGNKGDLSQSDQRSWFEQLRRGLNLRSKQVIVPGVPFHETSRSDCNYLLHHTGIPESKIDVKINPKNCPGLVRDLKNVQCDAFGHIVKRNRKDVNQRADQIDTFRYLVNTFLKKFILQHQKLNR